MAKTGKSVAFKFFRIWENLDTTSLLAETCKAQLEWVNNFFTLRLMTPNATMFFFFLTLCQNLADSEVLTLNKKLKWITVLQFLPAFEKLEQESRWPGLYAFISFCGDVILPLKHKPLLTRFWKASSSSSPNLVSAFVFCSFKLNLWRIFLRWGYTAFFYGNWKILVKNSFCQRDLLFAIGCTDQTSCY